MSSCAQPARAKRYGPCQSRPVAGPSSSRGGDRVETLRRAPLDGDAAVALIAWREGEPAERINVADTAKVQWSAALRRGPIILSDMCRAPIRVLIRDPATS